MTIPHTSVGLCPIHFPEASNLGTVVPGYDVIRLRDGRTALAYEDGGCGQIAITFETSPSPDPMAPQQEALCDELEAAGAALPPELERALHASAAWWGVASKDLTALDALSFEESHALAKACVQAGWQEGTPVRLWLYSQIAAHLTSSTPERSPAPQEPLYRLIDIIDMPEYNPASQKDRGEWGLRCASDGSVALDERDKVRCVDHGAMNAVNADRTLWRCLACGRGVYRAESTPTSA